MPDAFYAYDDKGKRYRPRPPRSYINNDSFSGPGERIEGLRSYHLAGGGALTNAPVQRTSAGRSCANRCTQVAHAAFQQSEN